jgi:hypothetical protein
MQSNDRASHGPQAREWLNDVLTTKDRLAGMGEEGTRNERPQAVRSSRNLHWEFLK